jgi:hypothetical protein
MSKYLFTFVLLFLAALSRIVPHQLNVAPITAIALFAGVYLERKHAFIIPIAAMLISDYFIGFYDAVLWVYISIIMIGFLGLWLKQHRGILPTIGTTITGSVLFFIVTNFGVWVSWYPHTWAGFIECYTLAIPFFRNTMIGDLGYVTVLFGMYELVKRYIPSMVGEPKSVDA